MLEFKIRTNDSSFLKRLGGASKRLFRGGKRAEKNIKAKAPNPRGEVYDTDADESLAMALGKDVDRARDKVVNRELEKVIGDL
jgi:hypothetical protein